MIHERPPAWEKVKEKVQDTCSLAQPSEVGSGTSLQPLGFCFVAERISDSSFSCKSQDCPVGQLLLILLGSRLQSSKTSKESGGLAGSSTSYYANKDINQRDATLTSCISL